ncbi:MAG: nicotinate phosphoribosyltransferase, partial [Solobacterium sp.]|nr:nicotinate phosphoribosyltransferase [Solobacterium sp.]
MSEIRVEPYIPDEDYDNPAMITDFYEFSMANSLFLHGYKDTYMVFDMFFRRNPDDLGYSISAGQAKLMKFLLNYHFTDRDVRWLRYKGMSEEFCEYLRTYRWKGDMYALKEGTVCYPQVPMVRIECDMVGAILIETYLLQTMNFHSLIATKATHIVGLDTNHPRSVMEFGTRRAQGASAGNDGAYAAVLGGCVGTANCLAEMKYGPEVRAVGTIAHSFIEFFPSELEAFRAYAETYPGNVSLLLDTYNIFESGLPNLIRIDDELIAKYPDDPDKRVKSARIDSGDLARGYKKLRKALDAAGKPYIKLVASNSLDETKIDNLEHYQDAHFDSYGVGENLITSATSPVFGGVYKLVAVKKEDGSYEPKMKCSDSASKAIIPGKLMAWRVFDEEGKGQCDIVSMDEEEIKAGEEISLIDL